MKLFTVFKALKGSKRASLNNHFLKIKLALILDFEGYSSQASKKLCRKTISL